jgi:integrase
MRGLGRVQLRGRIWHVKYWHRGKEYAESSGSSDRRVAEKLLKKRLGERESGKFHGTKQERVTYEQLKGYIRDDYTKNDLRSISTLDARFIHLDAAFAGMRAVDITPGHLHRYQSARRAAKAGAATVNRELACLRRMFSLAAKLEALTTVPVFPDKLEEPPARQGYYTVAEVAAIREHLAPHYQDVLEAYYILGNRTKALLGLTWGEVYFEHSEIRLDAARVKGKKLHLIPIGPELLAVLQRRWKARRLDTTLVFHYRDGQPIGDWRKSWDNARVAAGLPNKLRHDFRRTAVRDLVHSGVSEKEAMAYTGHSTASVFKRYQIVAPGELHVAADKLSAFRAGSAHAVAELHVTVVPLKRAEGTAS